MDNMVIGGMVELGVNLTELAVKGTVSSVGTKIKAIKMEKNLEIVKNKYEEIINELISEREEAIRIAQTYKGEIERYHISDEDINHLHETVERVLDLLKKMSPKTDVDSFRQFKELINIDTLQAMQLLGFNYKAAIGEPLTELCASVILSKAKKQVRKKK